MTSQFPDQHVQWMYCRKNKWTFFSFFDSDVLETALKNEMTQRVLVDEGRYEVDLSTREMYALYWKETKVRVVRGTWLYELKDSEHPFIPFEEQTAEILETAWTKLDPKARPTSSVLVHDHIESIKSEVKDSFFDTADFKQCDVLLKDHPERSNMKAIHRGKVPPSDTPTEGFQGPKTAAHVVFVIHGIGEFFCQKSEFKFPDIIECAIDARNLSNQMIADRFQEMEGQFVEYIPIEWCGAIRCGDDILADVSLHSLQFVRDLTNEILSDVLFYMAQTQTILDYVVSALNESYRAFKLRNPEFNGRVVLLGHSLGSVISYDMLVKEESRLEFDLDAFVAFGSPIGLFEAVKGKRFDQDTKFGKCPHMFNVYHPSDPVAYRIEPLVDQSFKEINPVRIPRFEGGDHFHYRVFDLGQQFEVGRHQLAANVSSAVSKVSNFFRVETAVKETETEYEDEAAVEIKECGALNKGNRIDYELQSTPLEHLNQLASALWAHTSYWQSRDFLNFVLKFIIEDEVPTKNS